MKKLLAVLKKPLAVVWAVTLPIGGCSASAPPPTFEVTLRLSPTPALIGPTRLIIDVADVGGDPVTNAVVSVEGLPEERTGRGATMETGVEEAAGRYVVPAFEFDAGGPWTIAITVTDRSGVIMTRTFPISVYGEP